MGEECKGAAVEDTSKEAKVNLTEYFARYELTRIRREWHDQFEAIAQDVVDIFKVCTTPPEELHHELKSIAKSLVDVFVIMVHVGEEMGSVIQCYANVIQMEPPSWSRSPGQGITSLSFLWRTLPVMVGNN